jgi:hypothetical protein
LSPVSAARGNGVPMVVVDLTRYAAAVRSWLPIVVALSACGDPSVEAMTAVREKVCACKTASCVEQELPHVPQDLKATPRIQVLARAIQDCYAKRLEAERPAPESDEDSAPEPESLTVPPAAKQP